MDTEKIDLALAELADLEWHWQHEGRPPGLKIGLRSWLAG
jgi:hypothetical protein